MLKVIIIGGGAAGSFASVHLKRMVPEADVVLLEAGRRTLSKVAITGGGRCNLTNTFEGITDLRDVYPRGDKLMRRLFMSFGPRETLDWFEREGVPLVAQPDGCIFPASQDAMDIVRTLNRGMQESGVRIKTSFRVAAVGRKEGLFTVSSTAGETLESDYLLVTTGGGSASFLEAFHLDTVPPVPSLFSFNVDDSLLRERMGLVIQKASVRIPGTHFSATGPLLITDWGMSGPAILNLSSYAARYLHERNYQAPLLVNWLSASEEEEIRERLGSLRNDHPRKRMAGIAPDGIPSRLWTYLLEKSGFREEQTWSELGSKGLNKLTERLFRDSYALSGKCRFKEEFVTCGGIDLHGIDPATLSCRKEPALCFAGEVLDIDAITGGFNLQAAWTTGYVAALGLSKKIRYGR